MGYSKVLCVIDGWKKEVAIPDWCLARGVVRMAFYPPFDMTKVPNREEPVKDITVNDIDFYCYNKIDPATGLYIFEAR